MKNRFFSMYITIFRKYRRKTDPGTFDPVRERCSLTARDGDIELSSLKNNLYYRQESVAFSNGVYLPFHIRAPRNFSFLTIYL